LSIQTNPSYLRIIGPLFLALAAIPHAWAAEPASAPVPDQAAVRHELSFPRRHNQYVHVESHWPVTGDALELAMPSWTPGSYLIRDYAGHVEDLSARTGSGQSLPVVKTAKNRWRIRSEGADEVVVAYDVWAGERNVATSWVEDAFALLNGAGIFLYSDDSRDAEQDVRVDLPAAWSGLQTALAPAGEPNQYTARDYDELVDSPMLAGNPVSYGFEVEGQPFALVLSGPNSLWDGEQSKEDVARIVQAQLDFWGVNPFERRYLFLNVFMEPFGGLEHDHSTVLMCSSWQMRTRKDYVKWLGLVSHEFFHSWNVRRMRPEQLASYDYDSETYTRQLWLAEGLSSYYDNLLLFRAGVVSVSEYLDLLADEIRNYESMPGRRVSSAEQASFDTWIKHYKPDQNSINSTISYYRKGALVGFYSDMAIRRETKGRASLDDVMRAMYRRYGPGSGGYPRGAFEEQVEEVAGPEVRRQVERLVETTTDPDVDEALEWYGLELNRAPDRESAENGNRPLPGGLGIIWDTKSGRVLADNVIMGHTGADAGVLPGDELLAVDGMRVDVQDYADRIRRLRPGDQAELTVVRNERLLTLSATVQDAIPEIYLIVPSDTIRGREKKRLEAWLGRPLRFEK
jgi:predicted metalloprotease with PDZ domain